MTWDTLIASKLEDITNQALLREQRRRKNRVEEAINWADLRCVAVEHVTTVDGYFWRVIIEEAAPGCTELCRRVREALSKELPGSLMLDVEVVTEW